MRVGAREKVTAETTTDEQIRELRHGCVYSDRDPSRALDIRDASQSKGRAAASEKERRPSLEQPDPRRDPLPPPFPIGTRLRYIGTRRAYTSLDPRVRVALIEPGMEVEIVETRGGHRGTGMEIPIEDEDGPYVDSTVDGSSIYLLHGDRSRRRSIGPAVAGEWQVIEPGDRP